MTATKRPKMEVARISEKEVRERFRLLGLLYQRLDGYGTVHLLGNDLLEAIGILMASVDREATEEERKVHVGRIMLKLDELIKFIADEDLVPVLYRERAAQLRSELYGLFLNNWADLQTDAPAELRDYARNLARTFMVPALGTLTSVKQLRKEMGLPRKHGPDYGPGILPPNLKAWPATREEFLDYLDVERRAILAEGHELTLAELAIRWRYATRPTRDNPELIDALSVAADRVGEILERYSVDWREFKRTRHRRRRDALN